MTLEALLNTPLTQKILRKLILFCSRWWNLIKGKPFSNNPHLFTAPPPTPPSKSLNDYQIKRRTKNLGLGLPPVLCPEQHQRGESSGNRVTLFCAGFRGSPSPPIVAENNLHISAHVAHMNI